MKKIVLSLLGLMLLAACNNSALDVEMANTGYAQGTTYQIKYIAKEGVDYQKSIDSLFSVVDFSMSTYNPNSLISKINLNPDSLVQVDALFSEVLNASLKVAKVSNGQFDPTVGPLVELWGFGLSERDRVDSAQVDSVKRYIGYGEVYRNIDSLRMPKGYRIDFNAIAQGYTVDLIAKFLESHGLEQYMVEVGGEVKAKGQNINDKTWTIGIDKPTEEIDSEKRFQTIISLENKSLATSGNYRKFWTDEETGMRYSHTINPQTGYPANNRLLSVSIITDECMYADAYATACMVMGTQKAISFINQNELLEGYLVYTNDEGEWEVYTTEGFEAYMLN